MDIRQEIKEIRQLLEDPDGTAQMFERLGSLTLRYNSSMLDEKLSAILAKYNRIQRNLIMGFIEQKDHFEELETIILSVNHFIRTIENEHQRIFGVKSKPGSEITKINCNRKWVLHTFEEAFQRKKSANYPVHFYFVGEDEKGRVKADSLVKRLIIKLREDLSRESLTVKYPGFKKLKPILIDILPEFGYKACCSAFRKAFCLKTSLEIQNLQQFSKRSEGTVYSKDHFIPFIFRVKGYPTSWEEFVPKSIEWFIQEFCQTEGLSDRRIIFFFILHVRENRGNTKKHQRKGLLSFFRSGNVQKNEPTLDIYQIMERFTQDHITILPQLTSIGIEDLKDWFEENDYISNEESTLEDLINDLVDELGGGDQWNMSDVEKKLEVIVKRHQNAANSI